MAFLEELEDRIAIQDLLVRYTQLIDHDIELWDEVFAPDAVFDYRAAGGTIRRAAEMKDALIEIHKTDLSTQHLIGNVVINLDGDAATGRSSVRALIVRPGTREQLVEITDLTGHYDDRFARGVEGWRIVSRATTLTWREYRVASIAADTGIAMGAKDSHGDRTAELEEKG